MRRRLVVVLLLAQLATSGCTAATPPSESPSPSSSIGEVVVGGVRLAPVSDETLSFCEAAASRLGRDVLCPTLLPSSHLFPETELCEGCLREGRFGISQEFNGPPGYVGVPDTGGSPSEVGHLNIWSIPVGKFAASGLGCPAGTTDGIEDLGGVVAEWVVCPSNSQRLQDSGHVLLQWSDDGVLSAVSIHTDGAANRALVLAIAEHLDRVMAEG